MQSATKKPTEKIAVTVRLLLLGKIGSDERNAWRPCRAVPAHTRRAKCTADGTDRGRITTFLCSGR